MEQPSRYHLKLFHKDMHIGNITYLGYENAWIEGEVTLLPAADPYKEFFAYMTGDDTDFSEDPPYGEDLLSPDNWYVEDDKGKHGIEVPFIRNSRFIYWRER